MLAARLLALALATVTSLLALELAVRVLDLGPEFQVIHYENYQRSRDPLLDYELRPGSPDPIEGNAGIVISSQGLRDREFSQEKPAGTIRIAAVGDSVTFGLRHGRSDSYPKQLESLLAYAAPQTPHEVLNLGVVGYNATQVAAQAARAAERFHPDVFVYGYVLNDPQAFSVQGTLLDQAEHAQEPNALRRALRQSRLFLLLRHLASETSEPAPSAPPAGAQVQATLSDPALRAVFSQNATPYFEGLHRDAEGWQRVANAFSRIDEARGDEPLLLAIFPILEAGAEADDYELAGTHERIAALAREHGFHVLDLQPAYWALQRADSAAGLGPRFTDSMHPDVRGDRVAALAIARELARLGLIPEVTAALEDATRDPGIAAALRN